MKFPSKDSALGRALRVLGYNVLIAAVAFAADPNVMKAIVDYYPELAGLAAFGAPILAFVYNLLRSEVDNV